MAYKNYFWGKNPYNMDPGYGNVLSYGGAITGLGTSLDARTANQIKEISKQLNTGIKTVELAAHSPEVLDAIPKDHLKEVNRLLKLTGGNATMHAPMIDPSGITQERWDEMTQKNAERQLWSAVERAHDLDPTGNIVVTMHASTAQLPAAEFKMIEEKDGKKVEKIKQMILIDPMGKIQAIKEEERYFPIGIKGEEVGKPIPISPGFKEEIDKHNEDLWAQQLSQLNFYSHRGTQELQEMGKMGKKDYEEELKSEQGIKPHPETEGMEKMQKHAVFDLSEAYRHLKSMYDLAYKSAKNENDKRTMQELENYANKILPLASNFENIRKDKEKVQEFSEKIEEGVDILGKLKPNILRPLRDFAIEKSAETAANLALRSYKEFGSSAPIISLENHPAQQSLLTTGEDLRDVINAARDNFVKQAVKGGVLSENEAKKQAEKLIGATWDVGHINMLRKYGYGKEKILEETKKVAPLVKHVHLSDNFGFEHTELPMGMGNVPINEIMKNLNEEGFKGKKVMEALSWWQHFSEQGANHALVPTMQGMGGGGGIYGAAPGGGYFGGYGTMLPEQHFSLYGAGFSNLPTELGGQVAGKDSRMSGTPMA